VVFDLSGTRYVGSAFLQMLVRAWHRLGSREGTLAICGVQEFCRKVLSSSGLDRLWVIYRSREEAVSALRQV
jgi:anti-anti-sigma factor